MITTRSTAARWSGSAPSGGTSTWRTTSLVYDARGNLTTSGGSTYGYDSENQLSTGPGSASLIYDPLLRLYQTSASGYTTTRFAYDGMNMIAEYNSTGTLLKRHVFGPGVDEALVEYDGAGTKTYLAADERGSIIARTNGSGVAVTKNSYDEYGIPGAGNAGRFQYTGQAWLPELGMQYSKARIYSPTLGRFLQTDPIGYGDGMNMYAYVGNDPVNNTDPTGLFASSQELGPLDYYDPVGLVVTAGGSGMGAGGGWSWSSNHGRPGGVFGWAEGGQNKPQPQNVEISTPTYLDEDGGIVVTARKIVPVTDKWVLYDGRYLLNPFYTPPWWDIGLDGFLAAELSLYSFAVAPGVPALTARGTGLLNRNNFVRLGYNWKGGALDGSQVYRIGIGKRWIHFDLIK